MQVIEEIKAAEVKADELIKNAHAQARDILTSANKEAYSVGLGANEAIARDIENRVAQAGKEAEIQKKQIIAEADIACEAQLELTKPKIEKAVNYIIERIVG